MTQTDTKTQMIANSVLNANRHNPIRPTMIAQRGNLGAGISLEETMDILSIGIATFSQRNKWPWMRKPAV